jgi:hypothetical protein
MRIILLLIVIAAIFAIVQSKRHNCEWGQPGWFDCVIGKAETPATAPTSAPEAPATQEPASETPQ